MVFGLLASALWCVTSVYSIGYMRSAGYGHQAEFFSCFAVCLSAVMGIAFAGNILVFVFFYEILSVATYPLVIHTRTEEARAAGRKYLAYTLGGGQLLVLAAVWAMTLSHGASFAPGGILAGTAPLSVLGLLFVLFMVGVGVKAAVMPLHGWLPAAMVAPVPVSALLHAVAVVKAGAFGTVRIVGFVFGIDLMRALGADIILACFAGVTIIFGSLLALAQTDLKKRLAYSTVSQLSYIVLGAALGSAAAFAGAVFHIAAHGFMKITMFMCAGSFYTKTHSQEIKKLAGIGRSQPATLGAFTVGAVGLIGIPLIAGFVGKWNLARGALDAGHGVFIAVLIGSALLNAAYFLPIVYQGFFGGPKGEFKFEEPRPELWIPPVITAVIAILLGIWPEGGAAFYRLAWDAAQAVTGGLP